jgi:3-oxoacid CoA-transferase subunit A
MEQQKITIAEVEELLPAGSLDPNEIHIPGILVNRIFSRRNTRNELNNLQ